MEVRKREMTMDVKKMNMTMEVRKRKTAMEAKKRRMLREAERDVDHRHHPIILAAATTGTLQNEKQNCRQSSLAMKAKTMMRRRKKKKEMSRQVMYRWGMNLYRQLLYHIALLREEAEHRESASFKRDRVAENLHKKWETISIFLLQLVLGRKFMGRNGNPSGLFCISVIPALDGLIWDRMENVWGMTVIHE